MDNKTPMTKFKKKLLTAVFLLLAIPFLQTNASNGVDTGICDTVKQEAIRLCNACASSGRQIKQEVNPMLSSYFSQESYTCNNISPLSSTQSGQSFFFDQINCKNIRQTQCTSSSSNSPETPNLTPSDSEFFNVSDPNLGLTAPEQGTRFQDAVEADGPILGPILLIINFLTAIISTLAILALVVGSFFMITARGEESQITRGKDIVKNSIIALVIVLTSYTLIKIVQATVILIIS